MKISEKRKLRKATSGLINSFIDLVIFSIAFTLQAHRSKDPITNIKDSIKVVEFMNPNSLKRALYNASHKGYLEKKQNYFQITELGLKRLEKRIPSYEEKRPWDGKVYFVIYDIPEKKKCDRDKLRHYLNKLGFGMLQQSVWITSYNPKKIIADFIIQKKLGGVILVTELNADSYIGGEGVEQVLHRVYNLDELNYRYRNFCKKIDNKELNDKEIIVKFLSILKRDPQLPFLLLPSNWWGEDAYNAYKKVLKKYNILRVIKLK